LISANMQKAASTAVALLITDPSMALRKAKQ
jgi:hypothetical protein